MSASDSVVIRSAQSGDAPLILELIRALAEYEKLSHEVVASVEALDAHLFGERPYAEALIAEVEGVAVGFALYCGNYSTFLGRPGIYLEDLFVQPPQRGRGIGKRLLGSLAQIALARGCGRLEWAVLDWNEPAIAFYRSLGARQLNEWIGNRLTGEALHSLAGAAQPR